MVRQAVFWKGSENADCVISASRPLIADGRGICLMQFV